ncbi:hypothetical protein SKAU_G00070780 [Synaphobranchus kaupii]|uniref:SPX domain-containing protein n=1 Tax=Synaphobranchus kaupii TaxID=118154 RepID=A0A9Q1G7K9_SYNKA|nr:hypothetical protein SKAU_G00070780 [Synaphobranchus kaupii]
MKFAEHLSAHITPEWRKQYIQYEAFKEMLYAAQDQAPSTEGPLHRLCLWDPGLPSCPPLPTAVITLNTAFTFCHTAIFSTLPDRCGALLSPEPASHWLAEKQKALALELRGLALYLLLGSASVILE